MLANKFYFFLKAKTISRAGSTLLRTVLLSSKDTRLCSPAGLRSFLKTSWAVTADGDNFFEAVLIKNLLSTKVS